MEKKPRIFTISFGSVYPLYVQKAEKKGRTKQEVDAKLVELGLDGTTRAEALSLEQHLSLCRAFG